MFQPFRLGYIKNVARNRGKPEAQIKEQEIGGINYEEI